MNEYPPDENPPCCPACGTPWQDHDGASRTCKALQDARARIAELEAIVARLPKYADTGQPIIGGDNGYIRSDAFSWLGDDPIGMRFDDNDNEVAIIAKVTVWYRAKDHYCLTIEDHEECDFGDGPIYLTEAAAKEAKP